MIGSDALSDSGNNICEEIKLLTLCEEKPAKEKQPSYLLASAGRRTSVLTNATRLPAG